MSVDLRFDTTATYNVETVATGEMTTPYVAGLACRMINARGMATTSADRADMTAERVIMFDPAVTLPEFGEFVVAGHAGRWAPLRGTFATLTGPSGAAHHKRVIVRRQDT